VTSVIWLSKDNEKEEYKQVRRMLDARYNITDANVSSEE